MIGAPIRYDRMRRAFFSVLSDALGPDVTVKWSRDSVPRDDTKGDLVAITPAGGLGSNADRAGSFVILSPDTITFTVDTATVGDRYSLYLNHYAYRYDAVALDTPTDIRDALLALAVADTRSPYAATASGADGILVTPTSSGDLWQADALPSASWTVVQGATNPAVVTQRQMLQNLTIGCFSKATNPEDGAHVLDARVRAALRANQYLETWQNEGVALGVRGPFADLSAIAGANWETRTSFDLSVGLESVTSELIDDIATISNTITFKDLDGSTILTETYSMPAV